VHLGDNTGEKYVSTAKIAIMFDSVRVTPIESTGEGSGSDGGGGDPLGGGCSTTGSSGALTIVLVAGVLLRRRRHHHPCSRSARA